MASGRGFPTAWACARSGWGPRAWAGRAVSAAEPDAGGAAAAAALGMGGAPAASAGGRCERPPLIPRVAASQGGGMLGKGVVGGGGGTKAPKPSFVSYVRPEVRGRRAGGASYWSGRGEGRLQPLTRHRKSRGRFLPGCRREAERSEAPRGALGFPAGPAEDPRRGQAGARVQGPACWRPGEGARAGKVLRPGTLLATVEGSWVWGTERGEEQGRLDPLGDLPRACSPGGSALPLEFLSESVELAYLSCLLLRVLFDAAGGIPCTASRFPSALQGESVGRSRPQSASTSSL